MYDIIIIGAGMAGMTAALYCLRTDKSVLLIEAETVGGQIANSPRVENYPTVEAIGGSELANRLFEQVLGLGAEFELERVNKVEKLAEKHFVVTTDYGTHEARAVIVAAGAKHRPLGLDREAELVGKGVSYCAVCDGPFFKGVLSGCPSVTDSDVKSLLSISIPSCREPFPCRVQHVGK